MAAMLLLLAVVFLCEGAHDPCCREHKEPPTVCHLACLDDCGATCPTLVLTPPPPDPLERPKYEQPAPTRTLAMAPEPEETPPKSLT